MRKGRKRERKNDLAERQRERERRESRESEPSLIVVVLRRSRSCLRTDHDRSTALRDLAPRSHLSTSPANPEPRSRIRLRRDRTETAPIALRSQRNGWVLMNLTGFDEFFLDGFCFCVYLLRNGIIYLFGS